MRSPTARPPRRSPGLPRAAAAVQALCQLGLGAELLVPALLEALHKVVPSSRNLFDWTDEQGQLLRYFIEGPIDEQVARHYFDEFHNRREAEVMPPFAALHRSPAGIRSARELDHAGFFASALYHEIWRPQGFRYRIEAVVRGSGGQLLGSLVLYRGPGDRCFDAEDERRLAALLPSIARAIEQAPTIAPSQRYLPHGDGPQTLLLDAAGRVRHASDGARRLLMLARGGITRQALEMPLERLFSEALGMLLHRLQQAGSAGGRPAPLAICHENPWGRFTMQACRLQPLDGASAPLVQVTLQWSEPHAVALERVFQRLPLTAGQLAVCRALYRGQAQADIAHELQVAPSTVVDHVRKLYRSLDIRSADELRRAIDGALVRDTA